MNKVKVKFIKMLIILSISGFLVYIIYRGLGLYFQSINDIYKLIGTTKLVVNCL